MLDFSTFSSQPSQRTLVLYFRPRDSNKRAFAKFTLSAAAAAAAMQIRYKCLKCVTTTPELPCSPNAAIHRDFRHWAIQINDGVFSWHRMRCPFLLDLWNDEWKEEQLNAPSHARIMLNCNVVQLSNQRFISWSSSNLSIDRAVFPLFRGGRKVQTNVKHLNAAQQASCVMNLPNHATNETLSRKGSSSIHTEADIACPKCYKFSMSERMVLWSQGSAPKLELPLNIVTGPSVV
jgi:hypothetical protein